jgi:hypothetical protein
MDIDDVERDVPVYTPARPNPHGPDARANFRMTQAWEESRKTSPEYTAQQEKRDVMLKASARHGIRRSLEFLWKFKGEELREKIEFHNSWLDLVKEFSRRELTFGKDKSMAIAGVADFVQHNTRFKYGAGLWLEMLPFDLLWTSPPNPGPRPPRDVPTWSWTSVDGRISHRLKLENEMNMSLVTNKVSFRSGWQNVTPLISDQMLIKEVVINELVHNAVLRVKGLLCRVGVLEEEKITVIFDTYDRPKVEEVRLLLVLEFENSAVEPKTGLRQVHGIVLKVKQCERGEGTAGITGTGRFERVGYFWMVNQNVVVTIALSRVRKSTIEIV